jgi:hypothetical protein
VRAVQERAQRIKSCLDLRRARLQIAGIEGIATTAHLDQQCVESASPCGGHQLGHLGGIAETCVKPVHPQAAQFALGRRGHHRGTGRQHEGQQPS